MTTRFFRFLLISVVLFSVTATHSADSQTSFETVVYIPVAGTLKMKDAQWLESSWARISSQLHVDKVYLETYRSRVLADDQVIDAAKKFFADHKVNVAGAICFSDSDNGQFVSFTYTKVADREYVKHVAEMTARHFDEVILDDFFFANTKTPTDIAAKGNQSWTDFRVRTMDQVSRELVVEPARVVNPKIKIIIKFPNWYEHFQGNGYDLEEQPKIFDAIYAGTETRDPVITDQNLQQYEGYSIVRYFENIAPGRMGGGWVDTYDITYLDRYPEQLWLTVFAKAKEMTLFNYLDLLNEPKPGDRPWQDKATNVNWKRIVERSNGGTAASAVQPSAARQHSMGSGGPIFASVAGDALDQVKPFIDQLGKPIGVASYRPAHGLGEDFLHNFIGMIGIPIELYPSFPADAPVILLTESAKSDPNLIASIKAQLEAGKTVVLTSGLLQAMEGKGIEDLVELRTTGMQEPVSSFIGAFGPGAGTSLGKADIPILFPQIRFLTNDAWPVIRGIADNNGFPILLMNQYGKGKLFVLTIPDNFTDLYKLPEPVLDALRDYVMADFPVRIDAPAKVSLFAYDNGTFIVESFRDESTSVSILVPQGTALKNLVSGESVSESSSEQRARNPQAPRKSVYKLEVPPHSYLVFAMKK